MKDKKYKITQEDVGKERLLVNQEPKEGTVSDRPEVFVGQNQIVEKIDILIKKANSSKKSLPHLLFVGELGMGKRTLAHILAQKLNVKITDASGFSIGNAGDLIGILTNLDERSILLINDIDTLSIILKEFLYPALDACQIDFVIDKGPYAKTIKFNLKPFTLIGTTSKPNKVDKNLIKRFYSIYKFGSYSEKDISHIIQNKFKLAAVRLDDEALNYLTEKITSGAARTISLIDRVIKFAEISDIKLITKNMIQECLNTIEDYENDSDQVNIDRSISGDV